MDTYKEFCIRFWESTRHLDLYSMDGTQLDRLIVDALSKTNGGGELIKTSMNELSVLINAFNHNNRKIQPPSPPSNLDEAAEEYFEKYNYMPKGFVVDGFKAGAEWQKSQMLKEGVEGIVHPDDCEIWVNLVGYGYKFNDGDKVRIIIVKENKE